MTSLQLMLARVLYAVEEYHQADAPAVAGEDDARQAAHDIQDALYLCGLMRCGIPTAEGEALLAQLASMKEDE